MFNINNTYGNAQNNTQTIDEENALQQERDATPFQPLNLNEKKENDLDTDNSAFCAAIGASGGGRSRAITGDSRQRTGRTGRNLHHRVKSAQKQRKKRKVKWKSSDDDDEINDSSDHGRDRDDRDDYNTDSAEDLGAGNEGDNTKRDCFRSDLEEVRGCNCVGKPKWSTPYHISAEYDTDENYNYCDGCNDKSDATTDGNSTASGYASKQIALNTRGRVYYDADSDMSAAFASGSARKRKSNKGGVYYDEDRDMSAAFASARKRKECSTKDAQWNESSESYETREIDLKIAASHPQGNCNTDSAEDLVAALSLQIECLKRKRCAKRRHIRKFTHKASNQPWNNKETWNVKYFKRFLMQQKKKQSMHRMRAESANLLNCMGAKSANRLSNDKKRLNRRDSKLLTINLRSYDIHTNHHCDADVSREDDDGDEDGVWQW
eukprot:426286_1